MAGSKGGRKTKTSRTKQEAWKREERRKENKVEGRTKAKTGKEREEREMWAWDDPAWPRWELTLSGETMARLERIAEEQAALDAEREESVDVQAQSLRDSIVMDSWASSEIEGEWVSSRGLELAYDRPEEGRRTDPKASGVIAMQRMAREAPTIERETLTRMHAALFEEAKAGGRLRAGFSVGDYRKTAIVIRSPERIVYEAPPPEEVEARMGRFLEWYNSGGGGWSRPIASAMPEGAGRAPGRGRHRTPVVRSDPSVLRRQRQNRTRAGGQDGQPRPVHLLDPVEHHPDPARGVLQAAGEAPEGGHAEYRPVGGLVRGDGGAKPRERARDAGDRKGQDGRRGREKEGGIENLGDLRDGERRRESAGRTTRREETRNGSGQEPWLRKVGKKE